jgi:hypothetical protein
MLEYLTILLLNELIVLSILDNLPVTSLPLNSTHVKYLSHTAV